MVNAKRTPMDPEKLETVGKIVDLMSALKKSGKRLDPSKTHGGPNSTNAELPAVNPPEKKV